jgi:hypothetical protein
MRLLRMGNRPDPETKNQFGARIVHNITVSLKEIGYEIHLVVFRDQGRTRVTRMMDRRIP